MDSFKTLPGGARDVSRDMLYFLNRASEELSRSLEYELTFDNISRLIVPQLADWFSIDILNESGELEAILVAHKDPEKVRWAKEARKLYPPDLNAPSGSGEVLRSGRSEIYPFISDELIVAAAKDERHLELLQSIGFRSVMIVPMIIRGKATGVISFVSTKESERQYSMEDLTLAEEFARKVALTIENVRLYQEAESERERLFLIIETIPNMAWITDSQGRISYMNRFWFDYTGCEYIPIDQVQFNRYIHPDDLPLMAELWAEVIRTGAEYRQEVRWKARDGSYHWHSGRGLPVKNASGEIMMWIGTSTDIQDQKEQALRLERRVAERTAELRRLNEELSRSNQELESFAYVASHDLKQPLRMVMSFTGLLEKQLKERLSSDEKELVDFIRSGARRMYDLITGLLIYSAIGKSELAMKEVDCNTIVEAVSANLATLIEESGAEINSGHLPVIVANEAQIIQLFQNLLENAIKYRSGKKPSIRIAVQREGGFWRFSIQDNGIGISPEYFDRIFVIFQRLHQQDEYSGTGIGLSICKKIVAFHGGTIWLESKPGQGTTFFFTLPVSATGESGTVQNS